MSRKSIAEFDPSIYLSLPRMTVTSMLTLARTLIRLTPELQTLEPSEELEDPEARWPEVKHTADAVREVTVAIDETMVARIRGLGRYTRDDVKFDVFVDGLWILFRDRLTGWARYLGEGRQRLSEDETLEVDLEAIEALAERANQIIDTLFADGFDFLRMRYNEQAEKMRHVLEAIDAEGLDAELRELTGDELLPLLRACVREYSDMVHERLRRDASVQTGNLNEVGARLRTAIFYYVNAVIGTLHATQAASVESVEAALRPIVNIRLGRSVVAGSGIAVEEVAGDEEVVEAANDDGAGAEGEGLEARE